MKSSLNRGFFFRLFRWFCDPELFEELQGDLEEAYHDNLEIYGQRRASAIYRKEVLLMIRPSVIKIWKSNSKSTQIIMFKNYFKTSWRSLMKSPLSSFINLTGLSAAIGVCVFAYAFAQYTFRTDQFHHNKDRVFLTTFFADREGTTQQIGTSPRPLAGFLQQDMPQIEEICQISDYNAVVKNGDQVYHESIRLVDESFLSMFSFPLKWGVSNSLSDVNSIIISENMSIKYFGDDNPVGRSLKVKFEGNRSKIFKVTGVAEEFPVENSLYFDFIVNHENVSFIEPTYDSQDWSKYVKALMIMTSRADDIVEVQAKMDKYIGLQNSVDNEWKISSFAFIPLATLSRDISEVRDCIFWSNDDNHKSIIFLVVVSLFFLALASFNYINIAIVSAAKRLKEISMRKVIGATRGMVVTQFLAENILLTSIATMAGLLIGVGLIIPWFESMFDFQMGFRLLDPQLALFLILVILITGIISGLYPALYVARFQVVSIMKGTLKFGQKNKLTKFLLGFQLVLGCMLITSAVMFSINSQHIAKRSWGYDQEERLYIQIPDYAAFEKLRSVLEQNPNVLSLSGSTHHLGRHNDKLILESPEQEYEVDHMAVDEYYSETMGLKIKSGRFFQKELESDHQAIVINELFAENLKLENPIGKVLKSDTNRCMIVGIIENFHHNSFYSPLKPTAFTMAEEKNYRYLSLKVRSGEEIETFIQVKENWAKLLPDEPFTGGHQEDVWGYYFTEIGNHGKFWRGIASIAIIMAALGVYGLVTLNIAGRKRELSIRKTLGASLQNVTRIISKQYIWLYGIALSIGGTASYFLVAWVIDYSYEYHAPMNVSSVVLSVGILVGILLSVVAVQVNNLSRSSPVDGLRSE